MMLPQKLQLGASPRSIRPARASAAWSEPALVRGLGGGRGSEFRTPIAARTGWLQSEVLEQQSLLPGEKRIWSQRKM